MKSLLLLTLLILPLQARLGETKEECRARYGPPQSIKENSLVFYDFKKERFLTVFFEKGRAFAAFLRKKDGTDLKKEEIQEFVKFNTVGIKLKLTFEGGDWVWRGRKGDFMARYYTDSKEIAVAKRVED